ncbi:MAG TPA: 4a-hydroxytetrahydrobiopterin dehydratase [Ignavibacteria bacterium]|nr:4a-hydroxytetrahydrobiopterin dehydratase [Ignavibacteria bacterium]
MAKLTDEQITEALSGLADWESDGGSIKKHIKTDGFPQTLGLVTAIGALCQQFDHHPDWLTLKYAEVEMSFSTHSENGITDKDVNIAKEIDKLKF